jgi:hypothetical protein
MTHPTGDMRDLERLLDRFGTRRVIEHLVLLLNMRAAERRLEFDDQQCRLWEGDAKQIMSIVSKIQS